MRGHMQNTPESKKPHHGHEENQVDTRQDWLQVQAQAQAQIQGIHP